MQEMKLTQQLMTYFKSRGTYGNKGRGYGRETATHL